MKELLITCNSPGEVASWLRVTLPALRQLSPDTRLTVALVPCPYATGAEKSVVQRLGGVDEVYSPAETVRLFARGPVRPTRGMVLFLGGDPWHALLLGRRFGYRTAGYFASPSFWSRRFHLPMYSRSSLSGGERGAVVGDLMVDGLQLQASRSRSDLGFTADRPVLGLFPGSRSWHLRVTLAAYLALAERLIQARPPVDGKPWLQFVLIRSPFVDRAGLQKAIDHPWPMGVAVAQALVSDDAIVCSGGLRVPVVTGLPGEVFPLFDLALTIPGTNTAELACCAKPFVLVVHGRAFVGGGGLSNLMEVLPFLPTSYKVKMRQRKLARHRFLLAHPNQLAGCHLAPEVVLMGHTAELERELIRWLEDPAGRESMGRELRTVMGEPGAALRLARTVVDELETV